MEPGPQLKAFLALIAFSEGTSTHPLTKNDGYDVIVSGVDGPQVFTDFTDHPFANGRSPVTVRRKPLLLSTAAGRYQVMRHWWLIYQKQLGLKNFLPAAQDAVALQQIRERDAIAMIEADDVRGAIEKCSNLWASFPGNDYGQGGKPIDVLLEKYNDLLDQETTYAANQPSSE